jgi:hypothetical protein
MLNKDICKKCTKKHSRIDNEGIGWAVPMLCPYKTWDSIVNKIIPKGCIYKLEHLLIHEKE